MVVSHLRGERPERVRKEFEIINRVYPDYSYRIRKFAMQDPIAPYRNKVIIELLRKKFDKFIVFVVHNWGGGTLKYCWDMVKFLKKIGIGALFLFKNDVRYSVTPAEDETKDLMESLGLYYPAITPDAQVAQDLACLPIICVHHNHTVNFKNLDIWKLPNLLNVPYYITVHDYFYICPRINLLTSNGIFCNLPEEGLCEECLADYEITLERDSRKLFEEHFDKSIKKWRDFYGKVLSKANRVIFPSRCALGYYSRIFRFDNFHLYSHPDEIISKIRRSNSSDKFKIAIIGAIGFHKGYNLLLKLIEYSEKKELPFEYIVFGYTVDDNRLRTFSNVTITGPYKSEEELSSFIRIYKPDVALFLHIWPETYCYTVSEALRNGVYPVAIDLGAPGERLGELGIGTLLPYPQTVESIVEVLLALFKQDTEEIEVNYKNIIDLMKYYGINFSK